MKLLQLNLFLIFILFALLIFSGQKCQTESNSFTIAVIADPHIYGDPEIEARFQAGIDWINANIEQKKIEFVVIVGDIGWNNGQETCKEMLDQLIIPYVPVVGDNEVHSNPDEAYVFEKTFAPQFEYLSTIFENWKKELTPVTDPTTGKNYYFQNFSFDYKGLHILGLDWASRGEGLEGEQADLYDFPNGTFDWFKKDIESSQKDKKENIVIFSHHGMHLNPGSFSAEEYAKISSFTHDYADNIALNIAGHYHIYFYEPMPYGGYDVYIVGAIKGAITTEEPIKFSLFNIYDNGGGFTYKEEVIKLEPISE